MIVKTKKNVFIRALETNNPTKVKIFRTIFTINHPGISKILGFSYPLKDQQISVRKGQSKHSMNLASCYIFVLNMKNTEISNDLYLNI